MSVAKKAADIFGPVRRWRVGNILFAENDWVSAAFVVADGPAKLEGLGMGWEPYGADKICVEYITADKTALWKGCEERGITAPKRPPPCPRCNGTGFYPARDGIEAQRGLNDTFPGDPYPCDCGGPKP